MKTKRALTAYEELNMDGGAHRTNIDVARKAAEEGRDLIVHQQYYDGQRFHYLKYRVTNLQETPSGDVVGTVRISKYESARWEATRRLCDYAITGRI